MSTSIKYNGEIYINKCYLTFDYYGSDYRKLSFLIRKEYYDVIKSHLYIEEEDVLGGFVKGRIYDLVYQYGKSVKIGEPSKLEYWHIKESLFSIHSFVYQKPNYFELQVLNSNRKLLDNIRDIKIDLITYDN